MTLDSFQDDAAGVDGEPMSDSFDLDGVPLDATSSKVLSGSSSAADIDGKPLHESDSATSGVDGLPGKASQFSYCVHVMGLNMCLL